MKLEAVTTGMNSGFEVATAKDVSQNVKHSTLFVFDALKKTL